MTIHDETEVEQMRQRGQAFLASASLREEAFLAIGFMKALVSTGMSQEEAADYISAMTQVQGDSALARGMSECARMQGMNLEARKAGSERMN